MPGWAIWITGSVEGMVAVLRPGIDLHIVDHRHRRGGVAIGAPGHLAHVTVLAADALPDSRRAPVLIHDHFELDPDVHRHLVTAIAKRGSVI